MDEAKAGTSSLLVTYGADEEPESLLPLNDLAKRTDADAAYAGESLLTIF
jgi:hypothetical protein